MKVSDLPFTPTSPPLVPVLRSPAGNGTEDGGGAGGGGSRRIFVCLVLALMLLIPASCGRKAKPFLPQQSVNARVVDLKGAWQGGYIELRGGVSLASGSDSALTGAAVHYALYPASDPPCDGCPIEFQGFHTYGTEVIQDGRFACKVPGAVKGNVYYFEVQLTGDKGVLGPASNRVKVVVE